MLREVGVRTVRGELCGSVTGTCVTPSNPAGCVYWIVSSKSPRRECPVHCAVKVPRQYAVLMWTVGFWTDMFEHGVVMPDVYIWTPRTTGYRPFDNKRFADINELRATAGARGQVFAHIAGRDYQPEPDYFTVHVFFDKTAV